MARLRSLRASLGWLLVSVAVPLAAAGAALLASQWSHQRGQAITQLQDQARTLRLAVDRELALDRAVMEALAASRDIDRRDWQTFYAVAKQASEVRNGSWFVLVQPDGQNLLNTSVPFGTPLPNLRVLLARPAEAEWRGRSIPLPDIRQFDIPFESGRPAVSGLAFGPVSRQPVVATNVPVMRDGKPVYVLGLAYSADFFLQLLGGDSGPDGPLRGLIDGSGRLIARNRAPADFIGRHAPAPFDAGMGALPAEGVGETATLEGVPAYFAYSRSTLSDWGVAVGMPKSAVLAPAWRALWMWLAFLLAAASIGLFFAFRLWRRLAVPLDALARSARFLGDSSSAELLHRPLSTDIAEVEALRRALHDAVDNEQQRRRTEREREEAREELRLANARLVEADERKDEFLAMLSHELRNPLAAIRNVATILNGESEQTPSKTRSLNEILLRQTLQLARMVDDLLDVARITRGRVQLHPGPLRLDLLATKVAEDALAALDGRAHRLTVHAAQEVAVLGDEARLTQVLHNLLDNAAKYTPPGGRIALEVSVDGRRAVIRVTDNGRGIERHLLPHVFELFTQGARTLDHSQGGLGIGLTMVKNIVEMHGGTVEARSAGEGCGSEFIVRLPIAPTREAAGSPKRADAAGTRDLRLLVVEDNPDTAETLAMLLRMEGHDVEIAYDGGEGLEKANRLRPEAVLLDIGLPTMNGQEVCRALRQQAWSSRVPIIALTGWGQEDDHRMSREAGFDAHLVKPVDPAEMLHLLASLLSRDASPKSEPGRSVAGRRSS